MHCDITQFKYSGKQEFSISLVEISASVYGTEMTLNFPMGKKADIVESLSKAKIPFKSGGLTSISIQTSSILETGKIRKSLEVLASDQLITKDFSQEIATNFPNGYGGKMDLNAPFGRRFAMFSKSQVVDQQVTKPDTPQCN